MLDRRRKSTDKPCTHWNYWGCGSVNLLWVFSVLQPRLLRSTNLAWEPTQRKKNEYGLSATQLQHTSSAFINSIKWYFFSSSHCLTTSMRMNYLEVLILPGSFWFRCFHSLAKWIFLQPSKTHRSPQQRRGQIKASFGWSWVIVHKMHP